VLDAAEDNGSFQSTLGLARLLKEALGLSEDDWKPIAKAFENLEPPSVMDCEGSFPRGSSSDNLSCPFEGIPRAPPLDHVWCRRRMSLRRLTVHGSGGR